MGKSLDHESIPAYTLTVTARDENGGSGGLSAQVLVFIEVSVRNSFFVNAVRSNLYYAGGITSNRGTSGGAHCLSLAPGQWATLGMCLKENYSDSPSNEYSRHYSAESEYLRRQNMNSRQHKKKFMLSCIFWD